MAITPTQAQLDMFKNLKPTEQASFLANNPTMAGVINPINNSTTPIVSAPVVTPTSVVTSPIVPPTPTPTGNVVLPFSKDTATYKALVWQWYTDQMIVDAYQKAKSTLPVKKQNITTAQEIKQPVVPAVVPPVKLVEKTPQQIQIEADAIRYSDNSEPRLAEIANNLNNAVATNPNSLKTLDSFRTAYSLDQRSEKQVQVMTDWYTWYQKWVKLWLTPVSNIVSGYPKTITDTDLESLKISNPTKYAEVQTAIENKKALQSFKDELYGISTTADWLADTTVTETASQMYADYKTKINSEEVTTLSTTINKKKWEADALQKLINDKQKDVEKRFEWTWATKGKIAYIVAKETAELQSQKADLAIDTNTDINNYNSIVNTAKDLLNEWLQVKQAEQQEFSEKMDVFKMFYWIQSDKANSQMAQIEAAQKLYMKEDFWTAKAPNWKQSFDWGRTRNTISWIGWGYSSGVSNGLWYTNNWLWNIPTAAELQWYQAWPSGIGKWKLTDIRYNEIAQYLQSNGITKLDDKQFTQLQQEQTNLKQTQNTFNETLAQSSSLLAWLENPSWASDVASIFSFMKSLDPTSVVRESEFAVAQNTAWLVPKTVQRWENKINWQRLTDWQRKEFSQIAKIYIKNRAKAYDLQYEDAATRLSSVWVPSTMLWLKPSQKVEAIIWTNTETDAQKKAKEQALLDWKIKNWLSIWTSIPQTNTITTPWIYSQLIKWVKEYSFDGKKFKTLDLANKARLDWRKSKWLKN